MGRKPRIDETGNRYGRLTVVRWVGNRKWLCRCDCGNEREVIATTLRLGQQRSCGCLRNEKSRERAREKYIDEMGKRFGRLVVVKRTAYTETETESRWICLCDCGRTVEVEGTHLRSSVERGGIISCGCWRSELAAKRLTDWSRDHSGPEHHRWKGTEVSYGALHVWVKKHKTKTGTCSECGQTRYTEWANISGEYTRDLDDYREVCKPCHMRIDGHPWVGR